MTLLRSILRRTTVGQPALPEKAVFVSYGAFDSNSAGHVAGFARELAGMGVSVAVCARTGVFDAYAFGRPPFEFFTLADLRHHAREVLGFDGKLRPDRTVMLCWTPRKAARRPLQIVRRHWPIPYVVHLEDNEELLSERRADETAKDAAAAARAAAEDAAERAALLQGAAGVTVIEQRLAELVPAGTPSLLLEPGVDFGLFETPLDPLRRATLLRAAGAPADARVIVYPGNVHRANAEEMAELYRAVRLLRQEGAPLVLIKTGKDDVQLPDRLGFPLEDAGVLEVGQVDRPMLADLLKCADLFVQPGAPGPFNDYRLPSKIPEFMAVGRPIVLPATNVGLRLRDGEEAVLLRRGDAAEIAGAVKRILADPDLAGRLGRGARAFARRTYRWDVQGRKLATFLAGLKPQRA